MITAMMLSAEVARPAAKAVGNGQSAGENLHAAFIARY
jgi:hypothetical protein